MQLSSGSTLLHYRLVEQIGEGGMGAVWRAVDTTLDREVALKVLPQAFAGDAERSARFEREAKVLASLNHPNIATLYGLERVSTQAAAGTAAPSGSADGFAGTSNAELVRAEPEGRSPMAHASRVQAENSRLKTQNSELTSDATSEVTFLVMELVDGEGLDQLIARGPMAVGRSGPDRDPDRPRPGSRPRPRNRPPRPQTRQRDDRP